jgi:hypothetical protein
MSVLGILAALGTGAHFVKKAWDFSAPVVKTAIKYGKPAVQAAMLVKKMAEEKERQGQISAQSRQEALDAAYKAVQNRMANDDKNSAPKGLAGGDLAGSLAKMMKGQGTSPSIVHSPLVKRMMKSKLGASFNDDDDEENSSLARLLLKG